MIDIKCHKDEGISNMENHFQKNHEIVRGLFFFYGCKQQDISKIEKETSAEITEKGLLPVKLLFAVSLIAPIPFSSTDILGKRCVL